MYVESESRRIGSVQMPTHCSPDACGRVLTLVTPLPQRVALLKDEYAHFLGAPASSRLPAAVDRTYGKRHRPLAGDGRAGDWDELVAALLEAHYDPRTRFHCSKTFPLVQVARVFEVTAVSPQAFTALAGEVLAAFDRRPSSAS